MIQALENTLVSRVKNTGRIFFHTKKEFNNAVRNSPGNFWDLKIFFLGAERAKK
jgi:hypothetical protein